MQIQLAQYNAVYRLVKLNCFKLNIFLMNLLTLLSLKLYKPLPIRKSNKKFLKFIYHKKHSILYYEKIILYK